MDFATNQYMRIERPRSPQEMVELVRDCLRIDIAGGQSYGKLSPVGAGAVLVNLSDYCGITEYEPQEYVISARAGTPVGEISAELRKHNQYLPFDPPDENPNSTLGGVVAAGWSGPGSLRYGRLRDFILGVELLPGTGNWIKGGGRVVKNSAGFDLPKLVVGSLGCFGIIGTITIKVFPSPHQWITVRANFNDFENGLDALHRVLSSGITLDGCVLEPQGALSVRLGGLENSLAGRVGKLRKLMGSASECLAGADDSRIWNEIRNSGPGFEHCGRCKIPLRPSEIPQWQSFLSGQSYRYFYDQAGSVLIVEIGEETAGEELVRHLEKTRKPALCIGMHGGPRLLGLLPDMDFLDRIRKALDPDGKFPNMKERSVT